ncbi:hypothetical protein [Gleimia coleocanis]|uniref:hypothetical protein n=1 Tax=Gleimia coleocanis TaxID=103618 RepID=UPI0013016467|nr:hypothetical protein [Gleimia coleocanis]
MTFIVFLSSAAQALETPGTDEKNHKDNNQGIVYTGRSDQFHGYSPDGYELHLLNNAPAEIDLIQLNCLPNTYSKNSQYICKRPNKTTPPPTNAETNTPTTPNPIDTAITTLFTTTPTPQTLNTQPSQGWAIINIPSIFYTTNTPQTQTLDSELGNVNIKWIPQSYTYNFGDGTQLQTQDPGSPYPNQTVTHPYNKTGIYYPTLTTTWDAEVTLNNITLRFNGTHQTQSPPLKLEILKAHQDLTAPEN